MWDYKQPVKIYFGKDRINELNEIIEKLNVKNGLLITSRSFVKNNIAESIFKNNDKIKTIFSNVSPNTDVEEVDFCSNMVKENKIDFIVALGGGSVIDCAKAVSVIGLTDDSIKKYHGTLEKLPDKHLPVIAIPTTAGTGSEVTCVSVVTDYSSNKKSPIVSESLYPVCAIIDPKLTYSMPPNITASTGIDVLCHAIEGFWSKGHQPICDAYAIYATKLVFENLYTAYCEPNNEVAREKMCEASVIAGLAFTLPKTTASHACSFPLTNIYNIPHGEACGLTLDYFARLNGKYDDGRLLGFAKEVGFNDIESFADAIYNLKKKLNLRVDLKDFNLDSSEIDELVIKSRHPNLYNNPVEVTDDNLRELYESIK